VKLTEHDMLVTLATMALKMDDLTGHDVIEALRELGYGDVVAEARSPGDVSKKTRAPDPFTKDLKTFGPVYRCTDCGRKSGKPTAYGCPGDCEFEPNIGNSA
jgi:hypothetical protein